MITVKGLKKYTAQEVRRLNHFYRHIYYRLQRKDQNYLMVIEGKPGEGKSYAALRIASQIDPNFNDNLEKNVVYTPEQFISRIQDKDLYDGAVIIWEEVGTAINSRDWYTLINKTIGHIIQTFRKKHICLIMTVPSTDFMDTTVKKLVNAKGKMMGIDRTAKVSYVRIYLTSYESNTKTWYYKKPQISLHSSGRKYIMKHLKLPKVSSEISRRYEKMRADFIKVLMSELSNDMSMAKTKLAPKMKIGEITRKVIESSSKYRNERGDISATKIQYEFDISRTKAYQVRELVMDQLRVSGN